MTTQEMVDKINQVLRENNFGEGVSLGSTDLLDAFDVYMDIEWGDWKHEHMRANHLVREALKDERVYISWNEKVTEDDGSDCYSAHHTWIIYRY